MDEEDGIVQYRHRNGKREIRRVIINLVYGWNQRLLPVDVMNQAVFETQEIIVCRGHVGL